MQNGNMRKALTQLRSCVKGFLTAIAIAIGLGIAVVLLYTFFAFMTSIVSDTPPKFRVKSVTTTKLFTLTNSSTILDAGFDVSISISESSQGYLKKPAKVNLYYYNKETSKHYYLSSTTLPSFCPGQPCCTYSYDQYYPYRMNINCPFEFDGDQTVRFSFNVTSLNVAQDNIARAMASDIRRGEVNLIVTVDADYRQWKCVNADFETVFLQTCYDIKVGVPQGVMLGTPTTCRGIWGGDESNFGDIFMYYISFGIKKAAIPDDIFA